MLLSHALLSELPPFKLQRVIKREHLNHTLRRAPALPHEKKSQPKADEATLQLAQQNEFLVTYPGTVPEHKHM
jgi:hypothetical protein